MTDHLEPSAQPAEVGQREPYVTPRLQVFGGLATLTQNVGMSGLRDKAGTGNNKTM